MLTKNDLAAVGDLIDQKLEVKFEEKLAPIKKVLDSHTKKLDSHTKKLVKIDEDIQDLKTMTSGIDQNMTHQRKRLDRVEKHLQSYAVPHFVAYAEEK